MIDASKGFMKDGPKNRLRSQDIHKIVDIFNRQVEIDRYSRMVPLAEIADPKNGYNLNIPRYIDSSEPEDIQDLRAHLYGGIPERDTDALRGYWEAFPSMRVTLFKPNRPGYSDLAIDVTDVQQAILDSDEFKAFAEQARSIVADWFAAHRKELEDLNVNIRPNDLIARLGDDLLARFKAVPLLDEYDVYEQLMTYWHDTMHDDVFLIMNDSWLEAAKPRKAIEDKDRKLAETADLVVGSGKSAAKYKMDLLPPYLVAAHYFRAERERVVELDAAGEEASRAVDEFTDEHAVEEGLLSEAMDDGKVTKAVALSRLRDAKREGSDPDEVKALEQLLDLYAQETQAKKAAKDARTALDLAVLKKYGELSQAEIRQRVLEDKWLASIASRVSNEVNALTLALVGRIQELGERYEQTLSDLEAQLAQLASAVTTHLADMEVS